MNEEKETFEKFINLCETSDYVMVNGHLGTYIKDSNEIVFPRNGMCLPNIKLSEFEIHKLYGDKWVLVPDAEISYFYRVRFLNEVKVEEQSANPPKFISDEKPTIPTFVGSIKNYLHRPLG